MARLLYKCPHCEKNTEIVSEQFSATLKKYLYTYKCGHSEFRDKLSLVDSTFSNLKGTKEAYSFQKAGIEFAERCNFDCMIADSMGLGKTIQALLAVRNAHLEPCLLIVPSSLIYQWIKETQDWCSDEATGVCPIISSNGFILPGFRYYVISMDTLSRNEMWKKLLPLGIKSIIVDECHKFKDSSSKRSGALLSFCRAANPKKILLSGTPIKNYADEFFVPLNLLSPLNFPSKKRFQFMWLTQDEKGRYTRIAPWRLERFHEMISNFVIRREKEQVLTNLPSFQRNYKFVENEDEMIRDLYNQELDLYSNFLDSGAKIESSHILAFLAKLRRITAMAKIPLVKEYIEEFQLNNMMNDKGAEKLAVGIHHVAVRDSLKAICENQNMPCLTLSGEDSALRKEQIKEEFELPQNNLLVINIGSGGLGLNLQFCSNALIVERYWNAADEEQFEGRFYRDGQKNPVTVDYMMLAGSIDQWFHELVETKRQIFGETVANWNFTSDIDSLKSVAKKAIENRL